MPRRKKCPSRKGRCTKGSSSTESSQTITIRTSVPLLQACIYLENGQEIGMNALLNSTTKTGKKKKCPEQIEMMGMREDNHIIYIVNDNMLGTLTQFFRSNWNCEVLLEPRVTTSVSPPRKCKLDDDATDMNVPRNGCKISKIYEKEQEESDAVDDLPEDLSVSSGNLVDYDTTMPDLSPVGYIKLEHVEHMDDSVDQLPEHEVEDGDENFHDVSHDDASPDTVDNTSETDCQEMSYLSASQRVADSIVESFHMKSDIDDDDNDTTKNVHQNNKSFRNNSTMGPTLLMRNWSVCQELGIVKDEQHLGIPCIICRKVYSSKDCEKVSREHWLSKHKVSLQKYSSLLSLTPAQRKQAIDGILREEKIKQNIERYGTTEDPSSSMLQCPKCLKYYNFYTCIYDHVRMQHKNEPNYSEIMNKVRCMPKVKDARKKDVPRKTKKICFCKQCNKPFTSQATCTKHATMYCHLRYGTTYTCLCSTEFSTKFHYDSHTKDCETYKARYVCDKCGKVYKNRTSLYVHNKTNHLQTTRYHCEKCNKGFYNKNKYAIHLIRHNDERSCVCTSCGKAFKDKEGLRRHENTLHLNKYPYYCDKCGHGVDKKSYLTTHICGRVRRAQSSQKPLLEVVATTDSTKMPPVSDSTGELIDYDSCGYKDFDVSTEIGYDAEGSEHSDIDDVSQEKLENTIDTISEDHLLDLDSSL